MTQQLKITAILLLMLSIFASKSSAQIEIMQNYVFASDSIDGFEEEAASKAALSGSYFGSEYKVFMYQAKRDYVKQKYHLKTASNEPMTLFQNMQVAKGMAIGGSCNNEDFELAAGGSAIVAPGAVQGWTIASGSNANSCNPPALTGVNFYTVYTSPVVDPKIPTPVSSYFDAGLSTTPSGSCFIRMNNDAAGAKAVKLSKSFSVTPANALFQYAYLPVVEDGGHPCCGQAGFNIRLSVTNPNTNQTTILSCPQISVAVPSAACQFTPPPGSPTFSPAIGSGWSYHNWAAAAIDLTAYLGNIIQLDVVVVDCTAGGHGAYAYFDAKCAPMTVLGNGNAFPAGTSSFTLPTCGANSATICAPDGLGPYSWAGPGVVAPYNTPLMTNQCFTAGVSADFTLTMNPLGSCNPIVRLMTVTITPSPLILSSVTQAICGNTNAVVSFTAAGSASVNPTILWSPAPTATTSNGTNLGTATYPAGTAAFVVTVTALDPLGCKVTATVNINSAPTIPTVSIVNLSGSQSITCITPSIDLQAVSNYSFNPLTYFWSSTTFTSSSQLVNVVSASTLITLNVFDPVTNCATSATTSIRVNTVAPVTTVAPLNQSINCGPGVVGTATGTAISPTINVSHFWYYPCAPLPQISGGLTSLGQVGICTDPNTGLANGNSTFVVVNNINGCSTSKTVQVVSSAGNYPQFSVSSAFNFTLGCATRSVTDINFVGANTSPGGGVVSYTLLPPSFTGTNYLTSPTVQNYTVNTPGTYTMIVKDNGNLCETRIPLSVLQNTFGPTILANVATPTLNCFTPSVVLRGNSSTPNVGYTWRKSTNPPLVVDSLLTVATTTAGASVPSATLIDTYTLTILDNGNQCTSSTVVTIYQNTRPPKPAIALSFTALTCRIYSVNATNNSTTGILPGTFFATKNLNAILWQGPSPQNDLQNSSTYIGYTPGSYSMTVMDMNNGCTSKTTTILGDNRIYPVVNTNSQVALDCGAGNSGAKLIATLLNVSASGVDAEWKTPTNANVSGINSLTLTTDAIGEYILTVTTKTNGCASKVDVDVINGILTANFTADQTTGFAPLTVNFTNNSASSSSVTGTSSITSVWSFGNGTSKTTTANTTNAGTSALYTQPGTYTVTMFATKGTCIDTFVRVIRVDIPSKLEIPNVFTPNGDNVNDIFFVKAANLTSITAFIYDRWGTKIYELNTEKGNIAWDGKTQTGKEAPDGTYFYIITATGKDGVSYDTKGTVSLFR